ncbi:hypothetical protein J6590_012202 [Homalodisca vitripennis]|nr:hypothetical protein J6590_012202 [Homalodisca vitripennis]
MSMSCRSVTQHTRFPPLATTPARLLFLIIFITLSRRPVGPPIILHLKRGSVSASTRGRTDARDLVRWICATSYSMSCVRKGVSVHFLIPLASARIGEVAYSAGWMSAHQQQCSAGTTVPVVSSEDNGYYDIYGGVSVSRVVNDGRILIAAGCWRWSEPSETRILGLRRDPTVVWRSEIFQPETGCFRSLNGVCWLVPSSGTNFTC